MVWFSDMPVNLPTPPKLPNVEALCKDIADSSERLNIFIFNGLQDLQIVTQTILSPLCLPISPLGRRWCAGASH
jgi:hypothetical protein